MTEFLVEKTKNLSLRNRTKSYEERAEALLEGDVVGEAKLSALFEKCYSQARHQGEEEERILISEEVATIMKAEGVICLSTFEAAQKLKEAVGDKHKFPAPREVAMRIFALLANEVGEPFEPFLVEMLPSMLEHCAHKAGNVRTAAVIAVEALMHSLCPFAVEAVIPHILAACKTGSAWQSKVAALNSLVTLTSTAPTQLAMTLPDLVPVVTECTSDTKRQTTDAAKDALRSIFSIMGNRDVDRLIPDLISAVLNPTEVVECIHKLAATTFVQSVNSACMALIVPLLDRGFTVNQTAVKRQTATIVVNMSKLVDNPLHAAPFLPKMLPALEKAKDTISDPEARAVCEKAHDQLERLNEKVIEKQNSAMVGVNVKEILGVITTTAGTKLPLPFAEYVAAVGYTLAMTEDYTEASWSRVCTPYFLGFLSESEAADVTTKTLAKVNELAAAAGGETEDVADQSAEMLCDCQFTLAYGSKILLHNTELKLRRGFKYGLLGGNDSGKTTLMRAISKEQIEGFPPATELKTVFVEADIQGEQSHLTCLEYVLVDARIQAMGLEASAVSATMETVGFSPDPKCPSGASWSHPVSTLSGGWRMKLALARAMLQNADILLMDEPTNHLDVINVAWVKDYLNSLTDVTCVMVSHDSGLLNDVCTHILQIEDLKLRSFKGNLAAFVEKKPSAKAFFELKSSKLKFKFPQPGPLEGIKSRGKALMKMDNISFTYPGNEKPTISEVTVQVSCASRVACVGVNGAGKSTMIKVLTGELEPQTGETWKHPSCRVAYVAQHAFHHIENHLTKSPNEYIRWRYAGDEDKENIQKVTMIVTEEEDRLMKSVFEYIYKDADGKTVKSKRCVEKLTGQRRTNKQKEYEYEVQWVGMSMDNNDWLRENTLKKQGWVKHMKQLDAKIAARAGMYVRPLTTSNVEQHLEDVGLDREFGTHHRISALSGGQKVKVVLAAAMWNQPHILILDEPTNYLDRESLGALADAIREFEGGVVMITHNNEFCSQLCPETWVLEAGKLNTLGDPEWMANAGKEEIVFKQVEEVTDGFGNVSKVKQAKKNLSRKEQKKAAKIRAARIANGEDVSDEEDWDV